MKYSTTFRDWTENLPFTRRTPYHSVNLAAPVMWWEGVDTGGTLQRGSARNSTKRWAFPLNQSACTWSHVWQRTNWPTCWVKCTVRNRMKTPPLQKLCRLIKQYKNSVPTVQNSFTLFSFPFDTNPLSGKEERGTLFHSPFFPQVFVVQCRIFRPSRPLDKKPSSVECKQT